MSDDLEKRAKVAAQEAERRSLPGILIFRGNSNVNEIRTAKKCDEERNSADAKQREFMRPTLAVFLVGETPTGGVNQQQFFRSVYYTKAMGLPLRLHGVLGPMFSGSFPSLQRALEDVAIQLNDPDAKKLQVVSGSVTGKPPSGLMFHSMLSRDEGALEMVRRLNLKDRVMVLNEESTTYGRNISQAKADYSPDQPEKRPKYPLLHASYPRDISTLRNALQDAPRMPSDPQNGRSAQVFLTLKDTDSGLESVPRFATAQAPITQDAVLLHIVESIRREHVNTVVVTATNVLDSLLITRFLRRASPDVRVVTLDSDLLFVHGVDSSDYVGSLAVVNHPLNPEVLRHPDQHGLSNGGARFNGNIGGGIFTAFDALVRGDTSYRPDQWLTIVGRGLYWPVSVQGVASTGSQYEAPRPTKAGYFFYGAAAIGGLLFAGLYGFSVTQGKGRAWCAELRPRRPGYHMIANLAVSSALGVIAYPPAYLWRQQQEDWGLIVLFLGVALVGCIAAAVHAIGDNKWRTGLGIPSAIGIALATGAWLYNGPVNLDKDTLPDYFRVIRSADPGSGVAPNVPVVLLLCAVALWAWINKRRLLLAEGRDPRVDPLTGIRHELFESLSEPLPPKDAQSTSAKPTLPILRRPFLFPSRGACIIGAIGAVAIAILLRSHLRMVESLWYGRTILLLTAAVFGMIALSAFGLIGMWLRLRLLLRAFDGHPIREAFAKLPPVGSWSPLWPDHGTGTNAGLCRLADSVTMLHARFPAYYPQLADDSKNFLEGVKEVTEEASLGAWVDPDKVKKMRTKANEIVANLSKRLSETAWSAGASESLDKLYATGKGSRRERPEAAPDIGTYVAPAPAGAVGATTPGAAAAPERPKADSFVTPDFLAGEIVAIRYVALIRYVMLQIKNQLTVLTGGFVLTVIALNSYPFQGAGFLRWWITGAAVVLGLIVVDIFIQIEKDATLTRLTDRQQGSVGWDFYMKVLSAGAIPLLAAVASHFPSVGRFLFSWLQPALTALR
jgi:hypothetical protein